MSSLSSPFSGSPFSDPFTSGSASGAAPLSGAGFTVPTGDPGEIQAAARSWGELASRAGTQAQTIRTAAHLAAGTGSWTGVAATSFTAYAVDLVATLTGNAEAYGDASTTLSDLAQALELAQQQTRRALAEYGTAQRQLNTQTQAAQEAGQRASTATANAATAVHPTTQAAYTTQAHQAEQEQSTAQAAAGRAQTDSDQATGAGQAAVQTYETAVTTAAGRLSTAAGLLRSLPQLAGGGTTPQTAPGAGGLPFAAVFPFKTNMHVSTEDAVFGALGGYGAYTSRSAQEELTELRSVLQGKAGRWGQSYDESQDPMLEQWMRDGAAGDADDLAEGIAREAPQIAESMAGARAAVNFGDHFIGFGVGGVLDTVVHLEQGDGVVNSVASGAGSAAGSYGGAVAGGAICSPTIIATPVCAAGGAIIGGFVGDKIGAPIVHGIVDLFKGL